MAHNFHSMPARNSADKKPLLGNIGITIIWPSHAFWCQHFMMLSFLI